METGIPGLNWDESKFKGFKVHELPPSVDVPARTGRSDFYKMGMVNGDMTIDYSGQVVEIKLPVIRS
jgi:AraC family transcriptional activator of pobA